MRKLIIACLILCPASLRASWDRLDSERPAVWRASQTCNAFAFGVLSASPTIIHAVSVDSTTINTAAASYLATFNSTASPTAGGGSAPNFTSTGTYTATGGVTPGAGSSPIGAYFPYDAYFSSGVVVNKVGAACTTVWWDFAFSGIGAKPGQDLYLDRNYPWRPGLPR